MKNSDIPELKEIHGVMYDAGTGDGHPGKTRVNKYLYIVLAIFLGVFGAHQFYAKKYRKGIIYLLFCWTLIPEIIAFFDAVKACGMLRDDRDNIWI